MKLEKPSLPVVVSLDEAKAAVAETIAAKGWKEEETEQGDFLLLYIPLYVFNFEAFSETKEEETNQSVVSESQNGRMALNAFDSELDEEAAQLFEEEELNLEKKPPKEVAFEIQKVRINPEEAKQLAQIKMAAQLSTGKENIIISGMELFFLPHWISSATVNGQEYRIEINAVSSELTGLEELPERGKSYGELAKETANDLKDPAAWAKYVFSIILDSAKWLWNTQAMQWFVSKLQNDRKFQTAILVCIIILIGLKEAHLI